MHTSPDFQYLSIARAMEYIADEAGVMTLMHTLRQSLQDDLPRIEQCLADGNVPGANEWLHQLKGFTPVFCTDALITEVVSVEGLSKQGSIDAVRQAYASLAPKLAQLQAEVERHIAANP
jgi:HPt (histidine-containing phosphotransfer) domain-containing protein